MGETSKEGLYPIERDLLVNSTSMITFLGDMVPTTFVGKLIAFPAMMVGILVSECELLVCRSI